MNLEIEENNKRPVVIISLLTAVCLIGDSMLYIVLPMYWQSVGLGSLWEVGIILSFNRLVRLPLNPLVGWLYGKMSNRAGILLAAILAVLTTTAYGYVNTFVWWLIIRGLWGLSWTFLRLGAYYEILQTSREYNRGYFMGMYNGLYRLGSLFGMLIGGFCADYFGLRATAGAFGMLTCLTIPLVWIYLPKRSGVGTKTTVVQSLGDHRVWANVQLWWLMGTGLIVALVYQGLFAATLAPLIETMQGKTVSLWGIVLGCASLAGVLQAVRWGWEPWLAPYVGRMSDQRYGRKIVMALSFAAAAICFVLVALPLPMLFWLAAVMGLQLTGTALTTVADAAATDAAAEIGSASILTWFSFFIDFGAALGPVIGYFIIELWGIQVAYYCTFAVLAVFSIKWFLHAPVIYATKRRDQTT